MSRYRRLKIEGGAFFFTLTAQRLSMSRRATRNSTHADRNDYSISRGRLRRPAVSGHPTLYDLHCRSLALVRLGKGPDTSEGHRRA